MVKLIGVGLSVLLLSAMMPPSAGAVPIISAAVQFTDRFGANTVPGLPVGDRVQIGATIIGASTPDPIGSLTVQATQGATTVPLSFFPFTAPVITDPLYLAFIAFNASLTGSWSITATDSTGPSAPVLTPPIADPEFVPFVTNIAVSNAGYTPTISWVLPNLAGFDVDQTRIRIIEAATGVQVFLDTLPVATTSFTVPAGTLHGGTAYVYRISLEDVASDGFGAHIENRSNAFSAAVTVPEPGTIALLAIGLAGLGRLRRRAAK